jgi:pilus assembly protein Flp/PilA
LGFNPALDVPILAIVTRLLVALSCRFLTARNALKADERGVTLVEYALLLGLIAVICVVAVKLIGQNASTLLSKAAQSL